MNNENELLMGNSTRVNLKDVNNPFFLEKPLNNYNLGSNRKKIIAVSSSGKGGTGKSTTSVMLALHYQNLNHNSVLVDFDIPLGDVSTMLGMSFDRSISDFFGIPDDLGENYVRDNLLLTFQNGLKVLPALRTLHDENKENQEQFIRKIFYHLKSFDVIVVDTGPNFEPATVEILKSATDIVYVTDDYETTFQNIYVGRNILMEKQVDVNKIKLVVNRSMNIKSSRCLQIANITGIKNVYFLPYVKNMSDLVDRREYVVLKKNHIYTNYLEALIKDVTPEYFSTKNSKEKQGFVKRLFGGGSRK